MFILRYYNSLFQIFILHYYNSLFPAKGFTAMPCSELYAGSKPFSEIETKSMSEYIKSISDKFYAYISFHSYSQLLMHPYGYTKQHLDNYEDLVRNYINKKCNFKKY